MRITASTLCDTKDVHVIIHQPSPMAMRTFRKNTQWESNTKVGVLHTTWLSEQVPIPLPDSADPLPCSTSFSTVINYLSSLQPALQNFSNLLLVSIIASFLLLFYIISAFALSMHLLTELAHFQCLFTFNEVLVF